MSVSLAGKSLDNARVAFRISAMQVCLEGLSFCAHRKPRCILVSELCRILQSQCYYFIHPLKWCLETLLFNDFLSAKLSILPTLLLEFNPTRCGAGHGHNIVTGSVRL